MAVTLEAARLRSGKGSGDENFPVASWLVAPPHRRPIQTFYEFVRIADDIADHPSLSQPDKLAHLDRLEASLLGRDDHESVGVALRKALQERDLSPQHAQDLLRRHKEACARRASSASVARAVAVYNTASSIVASTASVGVSATRTTTSTQ